jgi:hypothetical protein
LKAAARGPGPGAGPAQRPGGDLCVLGAGNGSDLALPALAKTFDRIHLVDVDAEALEGCRARAPRALRERLVLHGGVDLSGFIARLDEWGEHFPDEGELGRLALVAIQGLLRQLGRRFDVVASTCVLSQLAVPFHRAWVLPAADWSRLFAAITAVHLATLAGATEPGGAGLLIFDVLSSKKAPGLAALDGRGPGALQAFVDRFVDAERAAGRLALDPDPPALLRRLEAAGLASLVASPRLTAPWLWNIGEELQLVYGLAFRRPAPV